MGFPFVLPGLDVAALWDRYQAALIDGVFDVAAASAILIGGFWIAGRLARAVRQLSRRHKRVDGTLAAFFSSSVRYATIAVVLIAALQQFGIQTTSIVAVLGAATLAIGLALQGTLANVAAGVMLVLFRPYRLGDFVEIGGRKGSVQDMNLFTTELATLDNVKVVLPNGQCWGAPIANFTAHAMRRVDLEIGVGYASDLDAALAALRREVAAEPRALAEPAPIIEVDGLGEYAVTIAVRVWCKTEDWMALRFALLRLIKRTLDAQGVEIPFPTSVQYHRDETGR